jgi:hypothetical protein
VKDNRTGFPDLIQFWPAERRYDMIEVKGPGDRLQDNQLRWIDYCGARHAGDGVLPAVGGGGLSYTVAVRALCEFTAKQGDLDLRFTPSPTAQEGIAGHAVVAARRGELPAPRSRSSGDYGLLHVRGRADGYDPDQNLIEEIKTYRGHLTSMPDNHRHLHWAQLRIYGHLLCRAAGHGGSQPGAGLLRHRQPAGDRAARNPHARRAESHLRRPLRPLHRLGRAGDAPPRSARRGACGMRFPHADFRPGQRQLAEAVFRANAGKRCLLAQAPTGIGKTVGSLFPVLKAAPKASTRCSSWPRRRRAGSWRWTPPRSRRRRTRLPLRVLELTARDKACEHPDKACHGDSCPLARGFYDRLPAARAARCDARRVLDRDTLRDIGAGARRLPLLPRQRNGALERHGRRRLQLLFRRRRHAVCAGAGATAGRSACWSTRRTTWCRARARCTAPTGTRQPARARAWPRRP